MCGDVVVENKEKRIELDSRPLRLAGAGWLLTSLANRPRLGMTEVPFTCEGHSMQQHPCKSAQNRG